MFMKIHGRNYEKRQSRTLEYWWIHRKFEKADSFKYLGVDINMDTNSHEEIKI